MLPIGNNIENVEGPQKCLGGGEGGVVLGDITRYMMERACVLGCCLCIFLLSFNSFFPTFFFPSPSNYYVLLCMYVPYCPPPLLFLSLLPSPLKLNYLQV